MLFDRFDYKQVAEVVTPLLKDPSRAKGREFEGAAVLVQLGIAQQQLAQWDAAIAAFTAAKTLTPRDPEIDAYLVQAHLTARRFDRAEAMAREALGARSESAAHGPPARAGVAEGRQGARANALLEAARGQAARQSRLVVGLADLYADQKRTADARAPARAGEKIVWRRSGDCDAHRQRLRGRRPARCDAEKELRQLMAADPLNADAMNSLGYMFADRGVRLPEAIDLAQRAVKIEPDNPAYLDTLGWALFKQGRTDEAAEPLGKAGDHADRQFGDPGSSRRPAGEARPAPPTRSRPGSARSPAMANRSIARRLKRRSRRRGSR